MIPRVTSEFWVSAFRVRMDAMNIPVYIRAKGDATAGALIVKIDTMNGQAQSFTRNYDIDGIEQWVELRHGSDPEVEETLARQRKFDPDLWIVEVEDRTGRSLFIPE